MLHCLNNLQDLVSPVFVYSNISPIRVISVGLFVNSREKSLNILCQNTGFHEILITSRDILTN